MPSIRAGDFRSEAKDRQRVKNHNSKWSKGAAPASGKVCNHTYNWVGPCTGCMNKPLRSTSRAYTNMINAHEERLAKRKTNLARKSLSYETEEALEDDTSDASAAEEVSRIPEPDHEIMYSFDSHAGPGQGSGVLSNAIIQAVERYENKETEKMVKEYDLVADGKEELDFADVEDDFELVDSAHLE